MRKRVYIALAVLLVMLAGVIAWQVLRLREPVYQGKRLSVWLVQYGTNHWSAGRNGELDKQAEAAIRHIGTNAIPTLLENNHDQRVDAETQVAGARAQAMAGPVSLAQREQLSTSGCLSDSLPWGRTQSPRSCLDCLAERHEPGRALCCGLRAAVPWPRGRRRLAVVDKVSQRPGLQRCNQMRF